MELGNTFMLAISLASSSSLIAPFELVCGQSVHHQNRKRMKVLIQPAFSTFILRGEAADARPQKRSHLGASPAVLSTNFKNLPVSPRARRERPRPRPSRG
jgi:hypothetical protein